MYPPVLRIRDLSVSFGSHRVLDGLDLSLTAGSVLCLTGENGVGKSTLLRCVAGLVEPDRGTVEVFGRAPDRSAGYWRQVAAGLESPSWYPGLTAREHVELLRLAHGADPADGRIDEILPGLGLADVADNAPASLSSGQRQRLLIAAVLARPSRLILLDEPERHLDPGARQLVAGQLRRYVRSGGSLLMASHDPVFITAVGGTVHALARTGIPVAGESDPAARAEPV